MNASTLLASVPPAVFAPGGDFAPPNLIYNTAYLAAYHARGDRAALLFVNVRTPAGGSEFRPLGNFDRLPAGDPGRDYALYERTGAGAKPVYRRLAIDPVTGAYIAPARGTRAAPPLPAAGTAPTTPAPVRVAPAPLPAPATVRVDPNPTPADPNAAARDFIRDTLAANAAAAASAALSGLTAAPTTPADPEPTSAAPDGATGPGDAIPAPPAPITPDRYRRATVKNRTVYILDPGGDFVRTGAGRTTLYVPYTAPGDAPTANG